MTEAICIAYETSGVIDRYVARKSSDAEAEDFERHLITCARCVQAVKVGAAIRPELAGRSITGSQLPTRRTWTIGAIAIAAGIIAIAGARWLGTRDLRLLGAISAMPRYGGVEVRAPARADTLFAAAMASYGDSRYEEARVQLAAARAAGADSVPASFFLGALALRDNNARLAVREFEVVLRRGETPYAAESRYYAAKAWLLRANAERALEQLALIPESNLVVGAAARLLADSIAEARR